MKTNQAIQKLLSSWTTPCYVMMVGVPGSGKSTFLKTFTEQITDKFIIASTDNLVEIEAEKLGASYSEAFHRCNHKTLKQEMEDSIQKAFHSRTTIFHDQTNMGRKSRMSKLSPVPASYFKICLNFTVDDKILQQRLDERAIKTGKVIPEHVMKQMFNSYVAPSKDEGFDLIIDVDNS